MGRGVAVGSGVALGIGVGVGVGVSVIISPPGTAGTTGSVLVGRLIDAVVAVEVMAGIGLGVGVVNPFRYHNPPASASPAHRKSTIPPMAISIQGRPFLGWASLWEGSA